MNDGGIVIDPTIIVSTPKVPAFRSLFEFFQKVITEKGNTTPVFTQFVQQSITASTQNAIALLSPETKRELTHGHKKPQRTFEFSSPEKTFVSLGNDSGFASELKDYCLKQQMQEAENNVGVVIVDHDAFDPENPVTVALEIVTAFQKLKLAPNASIVVAHCEHDKTGLDLLLQPQLTLMGAVLIERNGLAHWKLPS